MGRDGGDRHRLVVPPASPCRNSISIDTVVWAPGGHRLAYTAGINSDVRFACPNAGHDVTGTWVTPLAHPVPRKVSDLIDGFGGLSWSPHGRTLLVIPGFGGGPQQPDSLRNRAGLVALDVQTGRATMLVRAQSSRQVFHGQVAPNTGTLGFSLGPPFAPGRSVIWVAGTQGKHRHQLATVQGAVTAMSWSPDGRSLAVITEVAPARWRGGHLVNAGMRSMWVIGAQSPRPRELAVNAVGPILGPSWSPDGRQLAYIGGRYACHCGIGNTPLYGTVVYAADVATRQQRVILSGDRTNGPMLRPVQFTALTWLR
jgi:Tol biopolymer transport system component